MNVSFAIKRVAAPLIVAVAIFAPRAATAQGGRVASVAAAQRVVQRKIGDAPWGQVGSGAGLVVDSRLRTGKRSKVDVRFVDGSLLRLGQLSSVEFKSAKGVTLAGGQILYAALKPGRVLAGSAAAEIKGSVALLRLNADNSMDAELFLGATDITTPRGTVSLQPGQGVTAFADGTFSRIRVASPRAYSREGSLSELLEGPSLGPFTGSMASIPTRNASGRTVLQAYDGVLRGRDDTLDFADPLQMGNGGGGTRFPGTLPPPHVPLMEGPVGLQSGRSQTRIAATPSLPGGRDISPRSVRPAFAPRIVALDGIFSGEMALPRELVRTPLRLAQAPDVAAATTPTDASELAKARAVDTAGDLGSASETDTAAARRHLDEIDRNRGQVVGLDAAVVGVLADEGAALYGGQLHGFYGKGKFLVDLSVQPLRLHDEKSVGPIGSKDYSSINSANVRYRDSWGEIQAGRQRFLAGPTQATLFGSLVRQGSREVMDAVRISPRLGRGVHLEAAYLIDAFPRNLPFRISGRQEGFYGRAAIERKVGNFGINVLRYQGLNTSTGATFDFVLPVAPNKIELYGEVGRDVFRRRMFTVGVAFPDLFEKADIDLMVEYANVRASSRAIAPPREWAVRAYKRLNKNVDVLATLSRFSGTVRDTSLVVGVSVGARLVGQGDRYTQ